VLNKTDFEAVKEITEEDDLSSISELKINQLNNSETSF
jgi:hypothetical protein